MNRVQHLRDEASRCRRFAEDLYDWNDPTRARLNELASKVDDLASAIETAVRVGRLPNCP